MTASNKSDRIKSALPYLSAGLVSCIIILIVYAVNHIYPFGSGSVVCEDMVQQTIPNYTQFWDWLHHPTSRSLLFNWNTAAGVEIMTSGFYIFKPWEVLFTLIVPRNSIAQGIPFLLMLKFAACAVTMTFFLRRRFKNVSSPWVFTLSIVYAFSAFDLIYYTNMGWLDMAFLLPLLIIAALRMADTGKWLPYYLMLTYISVLSVYSAYMIFLFLFLIGFLYLALMYPKEKRKTTIVRFGVTSVLALLSSAAMNIPYIHYILGSTRRTIKEKSTLFETIKSILTNHETYSLWKLQVVFLCSGILFAFLVLLLSDFRKNKKAAVFFGVGTVMLVLPVCVESINLIWHMGSYISFPLRHIYLLVFFGISCAAWCIQNTENVLHIANGKPLNIVFSVLAIASGAGGIFVLASKTLATDFANSGLKYRAILVKDSETWLMLSFLCMTVCYLFALYLKNKKLSWSIATVMIAVEIGLLSYTTFGVGADNSTRNPMYQDNYIGQSLIMKEELPQENDKLTRIKDKDLFLNSNYPLLLDFPAMSNFTHLVSSDMTDAMEALGYSQIYTRVVDSPGTPLADALLNMNYTFSKGELNEDEYTFLKPFGDCLLYKNNFTLPVGLYVNDDFMDIDLFDNNAFDNTNSLYKALTDNDDDIFEYTEGSFDTGAGEYSDTVHVNGRRHVYLWVDIDSRYSNTRGSVSVFIDGERVDLSYFGSDTNYYYPNNFWNELIDCGIREDEDITIDLVAVKNIGGNIPVIIGMFDDEKLAQLCEINRDNHAEITAGNRSLSVNAYNSGSEDSLVYLAVAYDDGWSCTLNGKPCEIEPALGGFMAIRLTEGENHIEMKYTPYGLTLGIIVSMISLAAAAVLWFISRKRPIPDNCDNLVLKITDKLYYILMFAALAVIYLLPCVITIIANFTQ